MTEIRYRRRPGLRWRPARLRSLVPSGEGPGRYLAEIIDRRTGNTRTLNTSSWQLQVRHQHRWTGLARWAATTPELFTGS